MSKNVILFLVLFVLVAGGALVLLKNSGSPITITSSTITTSTDSAKPAPADAPANAKDTAKTDENKPADSAETPTEKSAGDAATKSGDAITGSTDAAKTDAAAEAAPAKTDADAAKTDAAKADDKAADASADTAKDAAGTPDMSGSGAAPAPAADAAKSSSSLLSASPATDIDMSNALAERTLGDKDAPITIIEYASMTCPHCARFSNDVFEQVKSTFIDTGKVYFIYRDYPLDTTALKAAMMARCADRSKYFDLIEVIFKNQEHWIKSSDPLAGLKQLGALAGMDESLINACIANPELQAELLRRMQEGQGKFKVNATPTFVFNNGAEYISGDQSLEDFQKVIDKLSKKRN